MNRRSSALLLGLVVSATALAFGSRPLGVAGVGLLLAAGAARVWAALVRGPVTVACAPEPSPATEGEVVSLRFDVRGMSRLPIGSVLVHGRLGRLGAVECRLRRRGRTAVGELSLGRPPRGRYVLSDPRLELVDHLGLESVSHALESRVAAVVHPRLVELGGLFSDAGRYGGDGRRLILRRPAGFDFHSVREYEQGESLRRVHWPTTARRGQLMVKELEDAPRDAAVVLLDCDPAGSAGDPPDSSFDAAVRAAGSVLRAYAARGRRVTLVTSGSEPAVVDVSGLTGEFRSALDALAAVEADAPHPLAQSLAHGRPPVTRAGELVVVTGALEVRTVDRLLDTAVRRLLSVVWIDAPSFAGRPTRADPGVLRLGAASIPVAVVRRGDDLAATLDLPRPEARAHG